MALYRRTESIYKVIRSDSSYENDKDDAFVILFIQDNVLKNEPDFYRTVCVTAQTYLSKQIIVMIRMGHHEKHLGHEERKQ